jgi:hypothetical protein
MRGFWQRMVLSLTTGTVLGVAVYLLVSWVLRWIGAGPKAPIWLSPGVLVVFPQIVGISIYAVLTSRHPSGSRDGELHCRECDYILRGIREQHCPEY